MAEERVNNSQLGEEEQVAEERVNNSQLGEEQQGGGCYESKKRVNNSQLREDEQMAVAVSPWLVSH